MLTEFQNKTSSVSPTLLNRFARGPASVAFLRNINLARNTYAGYLASECP